MNVTAVRSLRRAILVLTAAALASVGVAAVASAESAHAEAVLEEWDSRGGEVEFFPEAAPGPAEGDVEPASEPGFCEEPADASAGEVARKG